MYHKIYCMYIGQSLYKCSSLSSLSAIQQKRIEKEKTEPNTKHTAAEHEGRVKPIAETWGNRAVMRDGYQRHPATHRDVHSNPHTTVHVGHKYTHGYTGQQRACTLFHNHAGCIEHARKSNRMYNTPVVHMHTNLRWSVLKQTAHKLQLITVNPFLSACFLSSFTLCFFLHLCPFFFFSYKIPEIHCIPYFHCKRQPHSPAALQKSIALSNTPIWLQNPVMRYNLALSRMLYFPSDCHFPYITIIRLVCRGSGKKGYGWLSRGVIRFLSEFFSVVSCTAHTHTNMHYSLSENNHGQVGLPGGRGWKRESVNGEDRKTEGKRENKTTGKVGERRRGRKPPECFFASIGQKVIAWRG